ncbi:type II toxin-antitoxin system RelE/ParE family toxin [Candidatus Peregrinibacteria bacterium]|nr:type II toxin-antitoxin system RelE/ParE family toxin [Candidatus Peregrinibacteria bacterium]
MLYSEYQVIYYSRTGSLKSPTKDYIYALSFKEKRKIFSYIDMICERDGKLPVPFAKHIYEKLWELRIRYGNRRHRILYFIAPDRKIVLLSAFLKKSQKTPRSEIEKAYSYYIDYISYEKTSL